MINQSGIDELKKVARCCSCGRPMSESGSMGIIFLNKRATWKYPVITEIIADADLESIHRIKTGALAVVCDDCTKEKARRAIGLKSIEVEINYAIEFRDGECFYHIIENLENL